MRRPSWASWSSGTEKLAHWASTDSAPALSEQGVNSMRPTRRWPSSPGARSPPGAQAASAAAAAAASRRAWGVVRELIRGPRSCGGVSILPRRPRGGGCDPAAPAAGLLVADVLLAPDARDRQSVVLQRREAGVDHVRIAAKIRDVTVGRGREPVQELLHVAVAHVGVVLGGARGRQLAREAGHEAEAGVA